MGDNIYCDPNIETLVRCYIKAPLDNPQQWDEGIDLPARTDFIVYGRPGYDLLKMINAALKKYNISTNNTDICVQEYTSDISLEIGFCIIYTHLPNVPQIEGFSKNPIRVSCNTLFDIDDVVAYFKQRFEMFALHCRTHVPRIGVDMSDNVYTRLAGISTACTHAELNMFCNRVFYAALHSEQDEIMVDEHLIFHLDNKFVWKLPNGALSIMPYDVNEAQNDFIRKGGRPTTLNAPLKRLAKRKVEDMGGGFSTNVQPYKKNNVEKE